MKYLILLFALCGFHAMALAMPVINSLSPATVQAGGTVVMNGSGFGSAMGGSEVVADYGNGFFYALTAESWSDRSIKISVPDVGQSLNLKLQVRTAKGISRPIQLRLLPKLRTKKSQNYAHRLKVGEKGEDLFRLQQGQAACGQTGELFVAAHLKVSKRRFADAQIISMPKSGCAGYKPIKVRWFNEPTGFIRYYVVIKTREVEGVCPDRLKIRQ